MIKLDRLEQSKSSNPIDNNQVTINKESGLISIYNDGEGVDVAEHPTEKSKDGKALMNTEMMLVIY